MDVDFGRRKVLWRGHDVMLRIFRFTLIHEWLQI